MDLSLTPLQAELVDRARRLAGERFAPRADKHDREASFPFEDFRDLHDAGLLALCVPEAYGGLGAGFETYCLVAEQIAQGNAATGLCYNMHAMTMLKMGEIADQMPLSGEARAVHGERRARLFREVVERGVVYGQPHSEPVEQGEADQVRAGGRRFGTRAERSPAGTSSTGGSSSCRWPGRPTTSRRPLSWLGPGPWIDRTLYLAIPKDAPGVNSRASGIRRACGGP